MADLDYVGDSVDDLIEAAQGIGAAPSNPSKAALMARSSRQTVKRAPLGFGTFSLATLTSITLTSRVQRPFQADRLLVTASQLGITITSIRIGDEEQLLGGSVPAELYGTSAMADSKPDDFTPSPGGIDFSITITNTAGTTTTGAVGMKGYVKR
jgi:hypothetical protein